MKRHRDQGGQGGDSHGRGAGRGTQALGLPQQGPAVVLLSQEVCPDRHAARGGGRGGLWGVGGWGGPAAAQDLHPSVIVCLPFEASIPLLGTCPEAMLPFLLLGGRTPVRVALSP